jgi:hypothetical protein
MAYTKSIQAFANNVQRQKFKRKAEQQWKNPNMCAACIPMIFVDRAHKDALAPQDESLLTWKDRVDNEKYFRKVADKAIMRQRNNEQSAAMHQWKENVHSMKAEREREEKQSMS